MKRKTTYDMFIGLLALMASFILILKLVFYIPKEVNESFYYIDFIIWIIFIIDYSLRLIFAKSKINYLKKNIIDFLSIIPIYLVVEVLMYFKIEDFFYRTLTISTLELIRLIILVLKFKNRIIELPRINKFNYMIILTTIIIILGAVFISILEEMSFGDALWWSFVTFTTVGYGDVVLKTTLGRIVGVILMIVGIGFISITTSTLAVYIINNNLKSKNKDFKGETLEFIKYKIDNLDSLTDDELESICQTLKSLKANHKKKDN